MNEPGHFGDGIRDDRKALRAALGFARASKRTAQFIGAHDAVSARLGAAAGFEAVWVSGLGFSACLGRCDQEEVSWTEIADLAERIAEAVAIPVVLDGNHGFGDANVARLLARRVARRGVAGLSLEDKAVPRQNSLNGNFQLASAPAFAAKIRACREAVDVDNFLLVARTEALVAGETAAQAAGRAEAYVRAGADAVIVHSKQKTVDELARFMAVWSGACPIIAIPTTYAATPHKVFADLGVAAVIWANQLMRASIGAMQKAAAEIRLGAPGARDPKGGGDLDELLALANCGACEPGPTVPIP